MIECTVEVTPRYMWKMYNFYAKAYPSLAKCRRFGIVMSLLLMIIITLMLLTESASAEMGRLIAAFIALIFFIWGYQTLLFLRSYLRSKKKNPDGYSTVSYFFSEKGFSYLEPEISINYSWSLLVHFSADEEYYYFLLKNGVFLLEKRGIKYHSLSEFELFVKSKITVQN